ncbi:MAG: TonB-dependent receptor [Maricaulaceae bacterium]|jgi:outer membrane receptor protein involved in Fe transport
MMLTVSQFSVATAQERFDLEIPSSPVAEAIRSLSFQTEHSVLFQTDDVDAVRTNAISGRYSLREALDALLAGTPLSGGLTESGVITISRASAAGQREEGNVTTGRVRGSLLAGVSALLFGPTGAYAQDEAAEPRDVIVVTATKRETNLQDTALSITAIGAEEVSRRNLVGAEDYLRSVPSVGLMKQGAGYSSIVIRGLAINAEQDGSTSGPITGMYFGDTPLAGLGVFGNSADIKLVDMQRVEVLKGPQGTLYGAGAMGGVVRNIPVAPDLSDFSGRVSVGYSDTARLGGANSNVQAVLNAPIVEDEFAVRAVVYQFDNSGYYRNLGGADPVVSGIADDFGGLAITNDDVGASTYTGARISALWEATDNLTFTAGFLRQDIEQDGWAQDDIGFGGSYDQTRLQIVRGVEPSSLSGPQDSEGFDDELTIGQFGVEVDLGWATLSSSTSRVEQDTLWLREGAFFFAPPMPWSQNIYSSGENTTEELRLTSQLGGPLEFVAGYYYEDLSAGFFAFNVFGGDPALLPGGAFNDISYQEMRSLEHQAIFGEVRYDVLDRVTLVGGGRWFDQDRQTDTSLAFNGGASSDQSHSASVSDVSWKAGVEVRPTDDALLYANWSQGFRLGDVRPAVDPGNLPTCDADSDGFYDDFPTIPVTASPLDSDTVDNYEVGGKLTSMSGRLNMSATGYQIDWENIPVTFGTCGIGVLINAGQARSRGLELEAAYQAPSGLTLDLAASFLNAELVGTSAVLGPLGNPGDRLPGSPELTVRVGAQYDFSLSGHDAFVRGDYSHIGDYYIDLAQSRNKLGDYGRLDLNAGVDMGDFDVSVYAHNVTNEDALTSEAFFFIPRGTRLQPRTVGVRLGYDF